MHKRLVAWLSGGLLAGSLLFYAFPARADDVRAVGPSPQSYSLPDTKNIQQQKKTLDMLQYQLRSGLITPEQFNDRLTALTGSGDKSGMAVDVTAEPPAVQATIPLIEISLPKPLPAPVPIPESEFPARHLGETLSQLQAQSPVGGDASGPDPSRPSPTGYAETGSVAAISPSPTILDKIQRPSGDTVISASPIPVDAVAQTKPASEGGLIEQEIQAVPASVYNVKTLAVSGIALVLGLTLLPRGPKAPRAASTPPADDGSLRDIRFLI